MCIWQRSFDVRRRCGKNWSGGIPLGVEANWHAPAGRGKGMEGSQVFDKLLTSWAIKYQIKLCIWVCRNREKSHSFCYFRIWGYRANFRNCACHDISVLLSKFGKMSQQMSSRLPKNEQTIFFSRWDNKWVENSDASSWTFDFVSE